MDVQINVWAVILAAVSSMVVGSIWYSKSVFGTTWGKLAKVDMSKTPKASQMTVLLASTFVASLVMAYVLAHVSYIANTFFRNDFLEDALMTGFWLWLGFVATRLFVHDAFEGRRKQLTVLNISHEFVTIMLMALIIGWMGL
jgi:hypothetical protein